MRVRRGAGGLETGDSATQLMDAMIRYLEEFVIKEKVPLSTQQSLQYIAEGKPGEHEQAKKGHDALDSFKPRYVYDAMKEKSQLKHLLVRTHDQLRRFGIDSCWPLVLRTVRTRTRKRF